ncbi:MAG: response regulator [Candidatus Omnitrophica bacterium]|nr:response regulator [Candidatus Omnitrophota bacterium]MDD5513260.1 response regulator [Candidatus Omnitrophota bacterium]
MATKKILIADDEKDILDILGKKFAQDDYEVITMLRGEGILEKCRKFKPDLVILDIVLPDIDGYGIALTLRADESLKDTPIIFMTGTDLEYSGIEKRLTELGYCGFISKPCTFEEIKEKVKEAIESQEK